MLILVIIAVVVIAGDACRFIGRCEHARRGGAYLVACRRSRRPRMLAISLVALRRWCARGSLISR
jgi:hypothetical protein